MNTPIHPESTPAREVAPNTEAEADSVDLPETSTTGPHQKPAPEVNTTGPHQ